MKTSEPIVEPVILLYTNHIAPLEACLTVADLSSAQTRALNPSRAALIVNGSK